MDAIKADWAGYQSASEAVRGMMRKRIADEQRLLVPAATPDDARRRRLTPGVKSDQVEPQTFRHPGRSAGVYRAVRP